MSPSAFRFDFAPDSPGTEVEGGQCTEHVATAPAAPAPGKRLSLGLLPPALEVVVERVRIPSGVAGTDKPIQLWRREEVDVSLALAHLDPMAEEQPENVDDATTTPASNPSIDAQLVQAVQTSDLIPNVYEGGLKTWECALDMVHYLSGLDRALFQEARCIELGCGSGLPGCYAMQSGARVDFQDYNEQVLQLVTMPNVLLNSTHAPAEEATAGEDAFATELRAPSSSRDACPSEDGPAFYAGDWGSLADLLVARSTAPSIAGPGGYDLVLTTETIYSAESLGKLFTLIRTIIRPGGRAYVGAKRNYFGCSGSLLQLEQLARADPACTVDLVYTAPAAVRRDILLLQF